MSLRSPYKVANVINEINKNSTFIWENFSDFQAVQGLNLVFILHHNNYVDYCSVTQCKGVYKNNRLLQYFLCNSLYQVIILQSLPQGAIK